MVLCISTVHMHPSPAPGRHRRIQYLKNLAVVHIRCATYEVPIPSFRDCAVPLQSPLRLNNSTSQKKLPFVQQPSYKLPLPRKWNRRPLALLHIDDFGVFGGVQEKDRLRLGKHRDSFGVHVSTCSSNQFVPGYQRPLTDKVKLGAIFLARAKTKTPSLRRGRERISGLRRRRSPDLCDRKLPFVVDSAPESVYNAA